MPKVNPTPISMSAPKSSGFPTVAGGSIEDDMDQATIEARTTETFERLLDAVERRDQQLKKKLRPTELRTHLLVDGSAACGHRARQSTVNLEEVTCQPCLNVRPSKPKVKRTPRFHPPPEYVDQGSAFCPGCGHVLPLDFFGTYPAPKLSGKQHETCLPCRIPDTGIPDPGRGILLCGVCSVPLAHHDLGDWCFQ